MADLDWAWVAGLFEGEGCIGLQWRNGYPKPTIHIHSTDRDVLEKVVEICGGSVKGPYNNKRPNTKDYFTWGLFSKAGACGFLVAILPWLLSRRKARALGVLEVM